MTDPLAGAKKVAEAATPGPWFLERGGEVDDPFYCITSILRDRYGDNTGDLSLNVAAEELVLFEVALKRVEALLPTKEGRG